MRSDLRALIGRGLVLLNLAAAVASAAVVVLAWLSPSSIGTFDEGSGDLILHLDDRRALRAAGWMGLLLLLADGLFLLYGRAPRAPLRHIVSENRDGTVLVTREALENGLRSAGEALPEVTRLRVTVRQAGRRFVVHAAFSAPEGSSLPAVSQALRQVLRQRFEAMVQLPDAGRVEYELEFSGFSGRLAKKVENAV
ncbi:MAG TPA: hypothetical protein VK081_00110, partial [Planctomycetota bacterium]|nr:hypothetical protein [Planctomycetota bacterium]